MRLRSTITQRRKIAEGSSIRDLRRLVKAYGRGRWRKMKSTALVELPDGRLRQAELHWYEAHGTGRRELKIRRLLSQ